MLFLSAKTIAMTALRLLGAVLCDWIYGLIATVYQLFMTVARLNILSSDEIAPIYQRVTMILTIIMVFYITFEVVKYVVSPDTISDKEKGAGGVVKRMIIVIVLIAFVPRIFSMAYDLQSRIIENQVFSKVILGEVNANYDTFGSDFSANMLSIFYNIDEQACASGGKECKSAQTIVNSNLENLRNGVDIDLTDGMDKFEEITVNGEKKEVAVIKFDGIMAIVVGLFIVYILVMYSIDVGVRYAQLIFLQIMAPVSIIGYISPKKDGMFQKWTKQCITTYLDLFIRLAIINFILLIVDVLGNAYESGNLFAGIGEISGTIKVFTYIVLVLGLLAFAQKAPKMLGDILPGGGGVASIGYGFGAKGRFEGGQKAYRGIRGGSKRVAGAVTGAAVGIATALSNKNRSAIGKNQKNRFTRGLATGYSAAKAATRGFKAGAGKDGSIAKANAAARQSVQKDVAVADKGGTVMGHDFMGGHYQQVSTQIEREIKDLEGRQKAKDTVASAVKEMKVMKTTVSYKEDWDQRGFGDASARTGVVKSVEKASRIYAVSAKDAQAEKDFKDSILKALNTVYTDAASLDIKIKNKLPLTADEQKIVDERNAAFTNICKNLEIGSVNWNVVENEIIEAKRVSKGQVYTGKDASGNPITKTVDDNLTINEFADEIGDVADAAKEEASKLKYKEKTRKAQANAETNK